MITNPLRPAFPRARASACSWRLRARPSSLSSSISYSEACKSVFAIEESSSMLPLLSQQKIETIYVWIIRIETVGNFPFVRSTIVASKLAPVSISGAST